LTSTAAVEGTLIGCAPRRAGVSIPAPLDRREDESPAAEHPQKPTSMSLDGRHVATEAASGSPAQAEASPDPAPEPTWRTNMMSKNTICLWFDGDAVDAAQFYAKTFPDSEVGAVHRAPGDFPSGKQGDVLTVEFTVMGIPCLGLNGGPAFKHSEAFSFQVATDDQAETDRLWNAIVGHGGQASACGWCKDKWGLSWQITPRVLIAAISDPDPAAAKRAFDAMMEMSKIDIASIEAARRG
jgi:predicted 3-demethylubiquinone-9 3-methyltransferase (glyoxalase superfamily)